MFKKETIKRLVGQINLSNGTVDITDPCYDRDVWCRMSEVEVMPGLYNCYIVKTSGEYDSGPITHFESTDAALIVLDTDKEDVKKDIEREEWSAIGEIGVDSGTAGFFANKPDFKRDDTWSVIVRHPNVNGITGAFMRNFGPEYGDGFWTYSGDGDGSYGVYAIWHDNEIVAIKIQYDGSIGYEV